MRKIIPLDLYECIAWLFKLRGFGPAARTTDKLGERFYLHIAVKGTEELYIQQEFAPVAVFPGQTELKHGQSDKDINGEPIGYTYETWSHPKATETRVFSAGHFVLKWTKKFDVDDIRSWYDHSPRALGLGVLHGDAPSGARFALAVNEIHKLVNGKRNLVEVYVSLDT